MPRTRSLAWSELKIGLVTVFALVMAAVLVFAVGGAGGFFWQRYPLKTRFPNIATVKAGTPVRVAGIEVGLVTDIRFSGDGVEVWFEVSKDVRALVTDRSLATIGAISLLGEGAIDITSAPEGTPVAIWGYVPSGPTPGSIAALSEAANAGLAETTKLLADLRAGKGTLGPIGHRRQRVSGGRVAGPGRRTRHVARSRPVEAAWASSCATPWSTTSWRPRRRT